MSSHRDWTQATHMELKESGKETGRDLFQLNANEIEAIGSPGIENKEDYKENLFKVLQDLEENYCCVFPFEFFAKELNERSDREEAWESYEEGIHEAWEEEWEEHQVPILENKAWEIVEDRLNKTLDTVKIGEYRYDAGYALCLLDPIAFQEEVLAYLDSEGMELV